jgi:hypothetical protein
MRSRVQAFLQTLFGTVLATLREIFDESAYARFLASRGIASSRAAYAEFLAETEHSRSRRPRCC